MIYDIPEGTKVALPNDVSNEGRALAILAEEGLIKFLKMALVLMEHLKTRYRNPKTLNGYLLIY